MIGFLCTLSLLPISSHAANKSSTDSAVRDLMASVRDQLLKGLTDPHEPIRYRAASVCLLCLRLVCFSRALTQDCLSEENLQFQISLPDQCCYCRMSEVNCLRGRKAHQYLRKKALYSLADGSEAMHCYDAVASAGSFVGFPVTGQATHLSQPCDTSLCRRKGMNQCSVFGNLLWSHLFHLVPLSCLLLLSGF